MLSYFPCLCPSCSTHLASVSFFETGSRGIPSSRPPHQNNCPSCALMALLAFDFEPLVYYVLHHQRACVCVCAHACVCMCVCMCACAHARARVLMLGSPNRHNSCESVLFYLSVEFQKANTVYSRCSGLIHPQWQGGEASLMVKQGPWVTKP